MTSEKKVSAEVESRGGGKARGFLIWSIFLPIMGALAALFAVIFFDANLYTASMFGLLFVAGIIFVGLITSWWEKLTEKQQTTVYKVVAIVGGVAFVLWVTWSLGRYS